MIAETPTNGVVLLDAAPNPLARLDTATRLLAEAHSVDEVKAIRDKAEAARVYARQARLGLQAQNHAAEIKLRAERRAGELLADVERDAGGRPGNSCQSGTSFTPYQEALAAADLPHRTAARWQELASLPDETFERHVAVTKDLGQELTTSSALRLVGEQRRREQASPPTPRPVSVVETDQEALVTLLGIHAVPEPRILDVTHNRGVMWQGVPYRPHRLDRNPELHARGYTDTVADFRALPFPEASWDVLVFDPPHLTDAGDGVAGEASYGDGYGTTGDDLTGPSIAPLFEPFLREAARVLVPGTGIVLAKIADQVHGGHYQWQARTFQNLAEARGFTCCDLLVKIAPSRGSLVDPKWRRVLHVRQVHSYWLVLRNGPACGRRGA